MTTAEKIAFYEKCFDELTKEFARYDFHSDHHPKLISLLLAIHDRIDRLKIMQKHQEKSFHHSSQP